MKIVSWNIRHGGGSGERGQMVIETLKSFDADILVVPEFRIGGTGERIVQALRAYGYHVSHPPSEPGKNSVLVACRSPIGADGPIGQSLADPRHLWRVDTAGCSVVGVYMPVGAPKLPYWEAVVQAATNPGAPDLFIGDFNTGSSDLDRDPKGTPYVGPEFMDRMATTGFVDLWRVRHPHVRDYTWFSPQGRNGFRLDHAFGSEKLHRRVTTCRYDHAPRLMRRSDHSALVMEVSPLEEAVGVEFSVGCVYAFEDPGCPRLIKIGKDHKWPLRLRQAQSHTPRGMVEVGRWVVPGDRDTLARAERAALTLFPREPSCPGREWVQATAQGALAGMTALMGSPELPTPLAALRPYDDWRDFERPPHSKVPRRIWLGTENITGRLKIVHSPHVGRFGSLCPTYSRHGIRWSNPWGWPEFQWTPSATLHPLDRRLVELWTRLVNDFGFGIHDGRVGWLRDSVALAVMEEHLQAEGLVPARSHSLPDGAEKGIAKGLA
ncbi:MAG: endonuclease/exonuclease/phosphatase family protein [Janthinobacterium lividum]